MTCQTCQTCGRTRMTDEEWQRLRDTIDALGLRHEWWRRVREMAPHLFPGKCYGSTDCVPIDWKSRAVAAEADLVKLATCVHGDRADIVVWPLWFDGKTRVDIVWCRRCGAARVDKDGRQGEWMRPYQVRVQAAEGNGHPGVVDSSDEPPDTAERRDDRGGLQG